MITGSDESLDQSDQGSDGVPGHHPQKPQPPQQPPQVPFLHLVSQSTLDSCTDVDDIIFMMMQSKVQNLLVLLGSIPHTSGGRQSIISISSQIQNSPNTTFPVACKYKTPERQAEFNFCLLDICKLWSILTLCDIWSFILLTSANSSSHQKKPSESLGAKWKQLALVGS